VENLPSFLCQKKEEIRGVLLHNSHILVKSYLSIKTVTPMALGFVKKRENCKFYKLVLGQFFFNNKN